MTVKECYEKVGSDYEAVLKRLGSDAMLKRFSIKFLDDPSFRSLKENLEAGNTQEAFCAAHTLKGICANLGFDQLFKSDQELTELLCGGDQTGWEPLFATVAADYEKLTEAIRQLAAEG